MGPVAPVAAPQYLLRINEATGPPDRKAERQAAVTKIAQEIFDFPEVARRSGSVTPVHSHPGAEAAYVLAGERSFRTPHGVMRIGAGKAEAGHGADTPMQASSSGSVDLKALVMFVLDATKPFSSPATLP